MKNKIGYSQSDYLSSFGACKVLAHASTRTQACMRMHDYTNGKTVPIPGRDKMKINVDRDMSADVSRSKIDSGLIVTKSRFVSVLMATTCLLHRAWSTSCRTTHGWAINAGHSIFRASSGQVCLRPNSVSRRAITLCTFEEKFEGNNLVTALDKDPPTLKREFFSDLGLEIRVVFGRVDKTVA